MACRRGQAGVLPDGRGIFLLSNAAPAHVRDPLTVSLAAQLALRLLPQSLTKGQIALSKDGYDFSVCKIVQTCTALAGGDTTCKTRNPKNHNVGPSYPQGVSVVAPAPAAMRGLYVVATNNKEDVVVTKVPWDSLLAELA